MPRKINSELKARALRMVQEHEQDYPSQTATVQAVAKQLGLGRETVRRWVVQAEVDEGGHLASRSPGGELAEAYGMLVPASPFCWRCPWGWVTA